MMMTNNNHVNNSKHHNDDDMMLDLPMAGWDKSIFLFPFYLFIFISFFIY